MPKSCRAPHCSNAAGQARAPGRRLSFYKFPLQDAARLRQWLAQMRQENWVPTRHQHLCSDHFEPSCFEYRWGVRYLRPDAVPTIFPGPGTPPKRTSPSKPPCNAQPKQPLRENRAEPVAVGQPLVPEAAVLEAVAVTLEPGSAAAPVYVESPHRAAPLLGPVSVLRLLEPGDAVALAVPKGPTDGPEPSTGCAVVLSPSPHTLVARVEQPEHGGLVIEEVAIEPAAAPPPSPVVAYFETVPTAPTAPPAAAPETLLSSALTLPIVSTVPIVSNTAAAASPRGELSTDELVGVVLVLQRKVKVLQQRHRRHCARLEAMEGLVEQLRRESLLSEEKLKLLEAACLQPGPVAPEPTSAVTIICHEDEDALVYAVPPPAPEGTACGLSLEQP